MNEPVHEPLRFVMQLRDAASRVGPDRSRGQSGYVLGVVLAAMTVGLLLITALLSLSFATHRAALAQQEMARQQRAADGALETAVQRTRVGFNTAASADPCAFAGPTREVDSVSFDWGTDTTSDDLSMDVYCDEVLGNDPSATGTVTLVGDDYTHAPLADALEWEGWDWPAALGTEAAPDTSLSPTLVHSGEEPLLFNGSVVVRSGAAGLLSSEDPPEPGAVSVSGEYRQGAVGHLGSATEPCGMLRFDNAEPTGAVDLARTAVVDSDLVPGCGDSGVADGIVPTPVSSPDVGPDRTVGSCAGGTTVTFEPGNYGATATAALNAMFDGSCPGSVFHFRPGVYRFTVAGATDALTFDDDTSAFVFGTLEGSGVDAHCVPGTLGGGAEVRFTGRSTFRHLGGNVSICGEPGASFALAQEDEAQAEVVFDPATLANETHCTSAGCGQPDFVDLANVLAPATGDDDAVGTVDCSPTSSWCNLGFNVRLLASGNRPVEDLRLLWTSSEVPPAHLANDRRVLAVLTDAGGATICSRDIRAGRTPGFISEVDFSDCIPSGMVEGDLNGANLLLRFAYQPNTYTTSGFEVIELSLRGLTMLVNATDIDASSAASDWSQWRDASPGTLPSVLADGDPWARPMAGQCGPHAGYWWLPNEFCEYDPSEIVPQEILLEDMQVTAAGFDPGDVLDRVMLAVDNRAGDSYVAAPIGGDNRGSTSVEVTLASGDSCSVPMQDYNTYTRSENVYYIDLARGDCEDLLGGQTAAALDGASVRFSITPERGSYVGAGYYGALGLRLPYIDHIHLTATTEAEDAIVRARATVDTSSNTRFTVHGNVVMPRTSLNVAWTGTVGVEPIVNGDLELDSLGSLADPGASVGIVCCGDGQREARLIAALDDPALDPDERVRAVARASFRRTSGDLADVVVNGWQFCGSKGCPLPDDSSSLSPP